MKKVLYVLVTLCVTFLGAAEVKNVNQEVANALSIMENKSKKNEFRAGVVLGSSIVESKIYDTKHKKVVYVNNILNTLVLSSTQPYQYFGYKAVLLKNKDFNAYSLPGGIILINDGIFKYLENEDQLAAIIAHEIGHSEKNHGLASADNQKLVDIGETASMLVVGSNVSNAYAAVGSIKALGMTYEAVKNGYDVDQEAEADKIAIDLMSKSGYDAAEFSNVLRILQKTVNDYGGGNYPKDRLERLNKELSKLDYYEEDANKDYRTSRFRKYK